MDQRTLKPTRHSAHEMAAAHMSRQVPVARASDTVESMRVALAGERFDAVECVCVVDDGGLLLGVVSLVELFAADPSALASAVVRLDWPRAGPGEDQERVAARAFHAHVPCVPIVDDDGALLGVVPAAALLGIARQEHVEDLHRLAGIRREAVHVRGELKASPRRQAQRRLPWLLVGLVGSLGAAGIVSQFEGVLQEKMALAFFVPMIVYLADAIGTQTEAVVVRALSLGELSLRDLLPGELLTGTVIGTALAALALPAVALLFGEVRIAIAVALSIIAAGTVATTIGLLLPWSLHRLGSDPALGSGPLATILQDMLSILIYFALAMAIV
ncbi:MAG: magnesium transporter [Deltaproteobacteria bacterium]|nr:magnesium transporter [Deltaproteobacteria bacterium]